MDSQSDCKKRARYESDGEEDSPEVKRLREDLLQDLDDDSDLCTAGHDLDSFMRSFEEEIGASHSQKPSDATVDVGSGTADSRPDLGFLLEASDDELGLPPSNASPAGLGHEGVSELFPVASDSSELSELWDFEDRIPSYDSLALAVGEAYGYGGGANEYVALDGLFDHSDLGFGSSENIRRPETLPAQ